MGEIKSSLEIALEKTKHLTVTDQDRATMHQEGILRLAQGIFTRYQNQEKLDLLKDLGALPEEDRTPVRKALVGLVIGNIKLGEPTQEVLDILGQILETQENPVLEKIKNLKQDYDEERKNLLSTVESSLSRELENKGIKGDAIVLRAEVTPLWGEESERLEKTYASKLKLLAHI